MRLQLHGVSKRYGPTRALQNVHLEVAAGEIHALLGENGAGKSTLVKIVSGAEHPDSGELRLDGCRFAPRTPLIARAAGVSMIYQEQAIFSHLSAQENILLGTETGVGGWIRRGRERELALKILAEIHSEDIPLDAPAGSLPIGQQQRIELARALVTEPKVLILDEPTSTLSESETRTLFAAVRKVAIRGAAIIYISHFLEESQELCSRYTVLRDGENVASGEIGELDRATLIKLMVGREVNELYPRFSHHVGRPVLELRQMSGKSELRGIDLTLREGEIFGLAGLVGAGRTELLRTLFGMAPAGGGQILLRGKPVRRGTPHRRMRSGIGLLGENRQKDNLLLNRSLADNLTLPDLRGLGHLGFIVKDRQGMATLDWMEKLRIRARTPWQPAAELSGGNQQKLALARLLRHRAKILLLDEPTRGIDIATKAQIYELIGELAADGKTIVFVSSYLPELLGVCDTIGVMCRGELVAVRPASEWSAHEVMEAAIGRNGI